MISSTGRVLLRSDTDVFVLDIRQIGTFDHHNYHWDYYAALGSFDKITNPENFDDQKFFTGTSCFDCVKIPYTE